jgi:hypothetical protein
VILAALIFAALTPFVLAGLLALALCEAAKLGDEQQIDAECKTSAPVCEGRSYVRSPR